MAQSPPVLKARHSLLKQRILPVVLKVQAMTEEDTAGLTMCRLKKDHPIENYTFQELDKEFCNLTGEVAIDVLRLAGKEPTLENLRLLMHFCIMHANEVGAPKRTQLQLPIAVPGPSDRNDVTEGNGTTTGSDNLDMGTRSAGSGVLEARMEAIERNISDIKTKHDEVGEALEKVRLMANNPHLTPPHILLATIESLVNAATRQGHKDVDYFVKSLQACRRFDDSEDMCGIALKLFGSAEDKRISSAVAEWSKMKKYKRDGASTDVSGSGQNSWPQPPYPMNPPWMVQPNFQASPYYQYQGYATPAPFRHRGAYRRVRTPYQKRSGPCHYCGDVGHFIANYPKVKSGVATPKKE